MKNIDIPNTLLKKSPDCYGVFTVQGDEYEPHYYDGDAIVFGLSNKTNPSTGNEDLMLIEYEGNVRIMRFSEYAEDHAVFLSLCSARPPLTVPHDKYKVIGYPYLLIRQYDKGEQDE